MRNDARMFRGGINVCDEVEASTLQRAEPAAVNVLKETCILLFYGGVYHLTTKNQSFTGYHWHSFSDLSVKTLTIPHVTSPPHPTQ